MLALGSGATDARRGLIVFSPTPTVRSPKAGLFAGDDRVRAGHAARAGGFALLDVDDAHAFHGRLSWGTVTRESRLRLPAVTKALLRQLHAIRRTGGGQASGDITNEPNPRPRTPFGGQPENAAPPSSASYFLGSALVEAYRVLDAAGNWIEHARRELGQITGTIGKASELSFGVLEEPDEEGYTSGDTWVLNGWRSTYPVRHRRNRIGKLSFVFDIGKVGRLANVVGLPVVIVAWSGAAHDWLPGVDSGTLFWPPQRSTELLSDRLIQWAGKIPGNGPAGKAGAMMGSWFYVAPLPMIEGAKLRSMLLQPALALLTGASIEKAFEKAPEILRFKRTASGIVPL